MSERTRAAANQPDQLRRFGGGSVALFGEMLIVGLVVTALSLTVILAVPALAAGVDHLRRSAGAQRDSVSTLFHGVKQALRGGWLLTSAYAVAVVLLCANVALSLQGFVPGGTAYAALSAILALGIAIVICRAAGVWRPGMAWADAMRRGRQVAAADPVGTSFVVAAMVVGATLTWMLPPLAVIVPGMMAFAVLAAELRREERRQIELARRSGSAAAPRNHEEE